MPRYQESRTSSKENQTFISKLAIMLKENSDLIHFNEEGTEVIINEKEKFARELLPVHFKLSKWKSFVRQMNMYNFKKINRGINTFIFVNQQFRRDNQHEYHLIQRKTKNRGNESSEEQDTREKVLADISGFCGENSIHKFIGKIFDLNGSVDESLLQAKRNVDEICKKRKNNDIKNIVNGIKEAIQIVEESGNKFLEACIRFQQSNHFQNFQNQPFNLPQCPSIVMDMELQENETGRRPVIAQARPPVSDHTLKNDEQREGDQIPIQNFLNHSPHGSFRVIE